MNSSCAVHPSKVNLYSWVPGVKGMVIVYTPSASSSVITAHAPHQPLNPPLMFTWPYVPAYWLMSTWNVTSTAAGAGASLHVPSQVP